MAQSQYRPPLDQARHTKTTIPGRTAGGLPATSSGAARAKGKYRQPARSARFPMRCRSLAFRLCELTGFPHPAGSTSRSALSCGQAPDPSCSVRHSRLELRHALNREDRFGLGSKGHRGVRGLVHCADQGRSRLSDASRPGCRSATRGRPDARPAVRGPAQGSEYPSPEGAAPGVARPLGDKDHLRLRPTRSALLLLGGDKAGTGSAGTATTSRSPSGFTPITRPRTRSSQAMPKRIPRTGKPSSRNCMPQASPPRRSKPGRAFCSRRPADISSPRPARTSASASEKSRQRWASA